MAALLEVWPHAAKEKDAFGWTPLHWACNKASPLEVVTALLEVCPDAVKEKDRLDLYTPLHLACERGAPWEVVVALLKAWPDAVKEKDKCHSTPLHWACNKGASFEIVAALLKAWPDGVKEKTESSFEHIFEERQWVPYWDTPLQMACSCRASFEITSLVLNTWLSFKENRTKSAIMTLQRVTADCTGDVKDLISHLFALCNNNADNPSPNEIMDYFVHIEMWSGATLVLDTNPAVIKTMGLDTKVMADLLSTVGRCCSLKAMWEVIRNEQDLLEGV